MVEVLASFGEAQGDGDAGGLRGAISNKLEVTESASEGGDSSISCTIAFLDYICEELGKNGKIPG